jgi:CSLREA domain-containing protein
LPRVTRTSKAALVLFVGLVGNLLIACETIDLTFTVNSTVDLPDATPGDGICRTSAATCTLRAAVGEANAAPAKKVQVNLATGVTYPLTRVGLDDANSVGDLDVSGSVRLVGSGSSIDAANLDRAVDVTGFLRLTGITVLNGATTGDGGGVRVVSGSAELHQSTVRANEAGGRGGGIAVLAGSITVRTSTISSNGAGVSGGGVDVASGVESERGEPGQKDARKVMAFVENARKAFSALPEETDFPVGPYDWMTDEPLDDGYRPVDGLVEDESA